MDKSNILLVMLYRAFSTYTVVKVSADHHIYLWRWSWDLNPHLQTPAYVLPCKGTDAQHVS